MPMFPELDRIAPRTLPNYRTTRYDGGGVDLSTSQLVPPDPETVRALYDALLDLMARACASPPVEALLPFFAGEEWRAMIAQVRGLGSATLAARSDERVQRVLHDVRGGGLQSIVATSGLLRAGIEEEGDVRRLFYLARDHLKIMRNALPDLDPVRSAADAAERSHTAALLVEKWRGQRHRVGEADVAVDLECRYDGSVSDRCLEFSALDRVLYNLLNNAARHAAEPAVRVEIHPAAGEAPEDVRFAVWNAVGDEQHRALQALPSLDALFHGGFTTTGSGLGLSICAEFVMNAYGLTSTSETLSGGYLGAMMTEGGFLAWFHWPMGS